ncbi:MAG: flavodoxin family protein [Gammaproteobacteria bacterium]|nr:flavodoxin family protein [Gammaproteobacteria bacterium]NIN39614.1 flavodoxin family protein [Gammaproteobacteria bacterium]NIO25171.1 flavodoxin family protein [Gammaproteobacteria bacterium]NIO65800.1 flavodoxin family protein [Gammaproteobacteria bacterium]NIP45762.1 NAD(P)H-dependent oxidoreductase [Gammaproteobacteria bacterium]
MNDRARILVINGSYRDDGTTDQVVDALAEAVVLAGAELETVCLRDQPIEFCLNCRECTQKPGETPGECVLNDGMQALIDKIERADGYVLASPTNFGSVTAVFKRFMERLVAYAYWPWGNDYPTLRKTHAPRKKAVLVSSCAAPGILGRWIFGTHAQLRTTARTIGADPVGTLFTGLAASEPDAKIPQQVKAKAQALAEKLLR